MKKIIFVLIFVNIFSSCFFSDYEGDFIKSPSNNYSIKAKVNRTNKSNKFYANVLIEVFNRNNTKISTIDSKAGDFNKWTLGWSKSGDTIILQSSDISNQAWVINNDEIKKIKLNNNLNSRAKELYNKKYNSK